MKQYSDLSSDQKGLLKKQETDRFLGRLVSEYYMDTAPFDVAADNTALNDLRRKCQQANLGAHYFICKIWQNQTLRDAIQVKIDTKVQGIRIKEVVDSDSVIEEITGVNVAGI